jgi:lipoprotein-anchoring transpeptidase ErfK/SrfK
MKTYTVATGKENSTPTGSFKIVNKLRNPTWFRTGAVIPPNSPENVLGSRWLGLDIKGYGIHGSRDINEIGKQVTMGCVRMRNQEIEEVYDIVPVGTEVTIID